MAAETERLENSAESVQISELGERADSAIREPSPDEAPRERIEKHTLRFDGAGALMVGRQVDRFDLGGGFALSYEYRLVDHLGVEGRYSAFFFPEAVEGEGFGGYQTGGLALRIHPLPHVEVGDLWVSGGPNAVFTGGLVRFGLEAGVGFEFHIKERWRLGPYVRYAHVFQPSSHELGPADAGFVQIGLSVAFSPGKHKAADVEPEEDTDEDEEIAARSARLAEAAQEEIKEAEEIEEDEPEEERIETVAERELREVADRILFAHGSDEPLVDSLSALIRIGQILEEHPEWEKITIEGHASETGPADVNYRLSERRAERVKDILVRGGVDPARIEIIGRGKDELEVRGGSESAHARNRRVVFKVLVIRQVPVQR
ncbi:MAG: OmpA family protein [Sandaracinaceae bacterium]|nr:OmpA family protein [Sandaracinaceae bacterium]